AKRKEATTWELNRIQKTITIEQHGKKFLYVKFNKINGITIDPLYAVYNWALLEGHYSVKNAHGPIMSKDAIISGGNVYNLPGIKYIYVASDFRDLQTDKRGQNYPIVIYNEKKTADPVKTGKQWAYMRRNETIY